MTVELFTFESQTLLFDALLDKVSSQLRCAIAQDQLASLVVSGGQTPVPLYALLAAQSLDWPKVQITLSDERWTHDNYNATNESAIRNTFGNTLAKGMQFFPLLTDDASPNAAITTIESRLRQIKQPFDMVILGMGADGHFASLFPHMHNLQLALDTECEATCIAAIPDPLPDNAPYTRLSLTLATLLKTMELILLVTGPTKMELIREIIDSNKHSALPVSHLLRQSKVPVKVYWSP